jgi:acylphosphatase
MPAIHVIVTGKVQNVGYRNWVARMAGSLWVNGWVRNCSDGSVEAVFSSENKDILKLLVEKCYQGPPLAKVEKVSQREITDPVPEGFLVRVN